MHTTLILKRHVETKYLKLLTTYVEDLTIVDDILGSQSKDDESCKVIQPTKKFTKVAPNVICIFLGNKTSCKKQDETQLFLEDLVLFMAKWFFPLNTCGCVS